jgi:hypothetical protein
MGELLPAPWFDCCSTGCTLWVVHAAQCMCGPCIACIVLRLLAPP